MERAPIVFYFLYIQMANFNNYTFGECRIAHNIMMAERGQPSVSYSGLNDRINRYGWTKKEAIITPKYESPDRRGVWERFISLFKREC